MFFLAYRAPQRAATPPQKMKTSKVGAGPWWGGDPSSVPGTLAPMGPLSCLSPEQTWGLSSKRGLGLKAPFHGLRCEVSAWPGLAGLGKRLLFFDPKSGIAKLELFLRLSGARAQRTVPVADNDVTSQQK